MSENSQLRAAIGTIVACIVLMIATCEYRYDKMECLYKSEIAKRDSVNERNKAINDSLMRVGKDYEYKKIEKCTKKN